MSEDPPATTGVHHVTGVVGDAQQAVDFYAGVLGLRLVKRTVNQEDALRYHLFFGDRTGSPGTVLTVFPYPDQPDGRVGVPSWTEATLAVPPGSLGYWRDRLADNGVAVEDDERFGEPVLRFGDPDGSGLALVAADTPVDPWADGPVPAEHAVRGVHGTTALPSNPYTTASVLETLGFERGGQDGDRVRYVAGGDRATVVDLLDREGSYGREGPGTWHHVAVRVPDAEAVYAWHDVFHARDDVVVSRVRDRFYHTAVYVREPGGVLFEVASDGPGFTRDEAVADLGEELALPPSFERDREMIVDQLPPLTRPDG